MSEIQPQYPQIQPKTNKGQPRRGQFNPPPSGGRGNGNSTQYKNRNYPKPNSGTNRRDYPPLSEHYPSPILIPGSYPPPNDSNDNQDNQ